MRRNHPPATAPWARGRPGPRVQAEQADARAKGMHTHRDVHYAWPIRTTMSLFTDAA
ncbi:hypothetical protein [Amycolatopsis thermoflava]|uniref:hypothetical protein n=1 Tax=Amycolatopsis thermoflava TaxID=84480 RepID=UPI003824FC05